VVPFEATCRKQDDPLPSRIVQVISNAAKRVVSIGNCTSGQVLPKSFKGKGVVPTAALHETGRKEVIEEDFLIVG
jgi:hypothetical protein